MKNIDKVELRKMSQKYMKQAQSEAKSDHCLLCGKSLTSFCNSHSVPKFSLKSIAENGEVVLASKLMENEISDEKSGVNKSGTFHLICDNCDNSFFGQVNLLDIQNWNYAPVSMNDIPNFLSREWAI